MPRRGAGKSKRGRRRRALSRVAVQHPTAPPLGAPGRRATGSADPRAAPFVLLAATAMELAALPFGAAISRWWEAAADRAYWSLSALCDVADARDAPRLVEALCGGDLRDDLCLVAVCST